MAQAINCFPKSRLKDKCWKIPKRDYDGTFMTVEDELENENSDFDSIMSNSSDSSSYAFGDSGDPGKI